MKFSIYEDRITKLILRDDGKNEFQFYKLNESGELNLIGSIFINDPILDFIWMKQVKSLSNGQSNGHKSSKKRELNGGMKSSSNIETFDGNLIALTSNSLLIISSTSNSILEKKSNEYNITKLLSAENGLILGSTNNNDNIIQWDLMNNDITKIKVPKFQSILLSRDTIFIGTQSGLQVGHFEKNKFIKENEIAYKKGVQLIVDIDLDQNLIQSSNNIDILTQDSTNKTIYEGDDIKNIQVINAIEERRIFIITTNSIQIYSIEGQYIHKITTSQPIDDILQIDDNLFIIWHNDNDIYSQQFSISQSEIVVSPPTNSQTNKSNPTFIEFDENLLTTTLTEESLEATLIQSLDDNITNPTTLIEICSSEYDSEVIKSIIIKLTVPQIEKLYQFISKEIAKDSSKNYNLTIWLKWILLINGNHIAQNSDLDLKTLRSSLSDGLKTLPNLYSIKGKLQLLKLQSELRNKAVNNTEEAHDITTTMDDDNIIFANGEVDDTTTTIA